MEMGLSLLSLICIFFPSSYCNRIKYACSVLFPSIWGWFQFMLFLSSVEIWQKSMYSSICSCKYFLICYLAFSAPFVWSMFEAQSSFVGAEWSFDCGQFKKECLDFVAQLRVWCCYPKALILHYMGAVVILVLRFMFNCDYLGAVVKLILIFANQRNSALALELFIYPYTLCCLALYISLHLLLFCMLFWHPLHVAL